MRIFSPGVAIARLGLRAARRALLRGASEPRRAVVRTACPAATRGRRGYTGAGFTPAANLVCPSASRTRLIPAGRVGPSSRTAVVAPVMLAVLALMLLPAAPDPRVFVAAGGPGPAALHRPAVPALSGPSLVDLLPARLVELILPVPFVQPVQAHHSLSAVYDEGKRITVEGVVREFRMVNPHPWVELTVASGARQGQWRLELDNLYELKAIGIAPDTFKPGDRLVVQGSPTRDASNGMYVRQLDRPADGFRYEQIGFNPRISRGR